MAAEQTLEAYIIEHVLNVAHSLLREQATVLSGIQDPGSNIPSCKGYVPQYEREWTRRSKELKVRMNLRKRLHEVATNKRVAHVCRPPIGKVFGLLPVHRVVVVDSSVALE